MWVRAAGADLNLVDYDKRAPLHIALEEGDEAMVELLLASGADPNAPSQDFISCVHYAATRQAHAWGGMTGPPSTGGLVLA